MPKAEEDDTPQQPPQVEEAQQTGSVDDKIFNDPLLNKERFENRRRMAWVSLGCMIGMALLIFFKVDPANLQAYDAVIGWLFGTFSGVILTYMGTTAWNYGHFLKNRRDG